jgi:phospholipase/carboxylesterase
MDDIQLVKAGPAFDALGCVHRVRLPTGSGPHPTLVMVHGLEGDEDVTWVFARTAGPEWLIISPRAPFTAKGGYSWNSGGDYDKPESYQDGLRVLSQFIERLPDIYPADRSRLVLLGFSQGAAMSYVYPANAGEQRVKGVAALAGFLPPFAVDGLKGLPVLILHGTRDERIPIEDARRDRDALIAAGAQVTYVEDDVGHKIGSGGMQALRKWLAERIAADSSTPIDPFSTE